MALSTFGGFRLSHLPVDLRLVCRIIRSHIHPVDSKDPIAYERALYLYAIWTHNPINFGNIAMALMKLVPFSNKNLLLPIGALITQIAKHHGISTKGTTMWKKQLPVDHNFLNMSESHVKKTPMALVQPLAHPIDSIRGPTSP